MHLHDFYLSLEKPEREAFASRVGTTTKYLVKLAYKHKTGFRPSAEMATQIEIASNQKVKRWDLIPEAWWRIWPELRNVDGAPKPPQVPTPPTCCDPGVGFMESSLSASRVIPQ